MKYKDNWEETKERFTAWWNRSSMGRPLMKVVAKRKKPLEELEEEQPFCGSEDYYLNVEEITKRFRNYNRKYKMMADAYPHMAIELGPGSMATYLGSEPIFTQNTIWYTPIKEDDWVSMGNLKYDSENIWWKRHIYAIERARELSNEDFIIDIPDIIENLDILSALRGPQQLCYDLVDMPDLINSHINKLDELYFKYYDQIYEIVKLKDNSSSYMAFDVWGPGKTAKLQCDFSAMMSPNQFRELVVPSLRKQCKRLNNTVYHLDGISAIKHLDALMEIEELDALQWTAGAGQPDSGSDIWFHIYSKVRAANKSLWIALYDGEVSDWVQSADKIVKEFGSDGLYLLFPRMNEDDAVNLIKKAERDWK